MRVVHVINSLTGSGGAENGLVREIVRLDDGLQQQVIMLHEPATLGPVVEEAGIEVSSLDLNPSQSGWNWTIGAFRLKRILDTVEPDVVHSSLASANLVTQLATRRSRIPVLSTFTLSGDVSLMRSHQPGADSLRAAAFRAVSRSAARQDHVWFRALTRDAAQTNSAALGIDGARVEVIPRGVPLEDFDAQSHSGNDLGMPTGVPVLLNVGRQTAQKGHEHLIEVFEALRRERAAHLVILGREGDGTPALNRAIARSGLRDSITVVTYTDVVPAYCRQADVFVFPSLMEGLGTAVIEAMAAHLPVVAFDIPPVREVTDDGRVAELVPVGDTAGMVSAIKRLLDSEEHRRAMTREARRWVEDEFTIEQVTDRLGAALHRIAGESGRRREG